MSEKSYISNILLCVCILSSVLKYSHGENVLENLRQHVTKVPRERDDVSNIKMPIPKKGLIDMLQTKQFFQDIFTEQLAPLKVQFGHVCENPNEWEQRFEEKDFHTNRHQGKVIWGDKDGQYGEQYWDFNH